MLPVRQRVRGEPRGVVAERSKEPREDPSRPGELAVSGSAAFLGAGRQRASAAVATRLLVWVRREGSGACVPPTAFCHVGDGSLKVVFLAISGHVDKEQSPALSSRTNINAAYTCTETLRTASRDPTLRHSKRCARAAHHGRSPELQPEPASVRRRRRLNATRCLPSGRNRSAAPPRRCRGTGPRPDASLRFWRSDGPDVETAKRSRRAPRPHVRLAMHGSRPTTRHRYERVAHANTNRNHETPHAGPRTTSCNSWSEKASGSTRSR